MIEAIKIALPVAASYLMAWQNPNRQNSLMTVTSAWLVLIVLYLSFGGR